MLFMKDARLLQNILHWSSDGTLGPGLLIWNNYNYHGIFCNIKLGTNTLQIPLHAIPDPQASRLSGLAPLALADNAF